MRNRFLDLLEIAPQNILKRGTPPPTEPTEPILKRNNFSSVGSVGRGSGLSEIFQGQKAFSGKQEVNNETNRKTF
jgi:hypothetical protein